MIALLAIKTGYSDYFHRTFQTTQDDKRNTIAGRLFDEARMLAMLTNHLKVYHGPRTDAAEANAGAANSISVPLGQIFPLLAEAVQSNRSWLQDFSDDDVTISTDLYEVILAYQHFRRPSA